jgi:hypothetical protein
VLGQWQLRCFCRTHLSQLRGSTTSNNCVKLKLENLGECLTFGLTYQNFGVRA